MSRKSVANVDLVIGPFTGFGSLDDCIRVGTRQIPLQDHTPVNQVLVHRTCETPITYKQTCKSCKSEIRKPVKGTPSPQPKKATTCENPACLKDLTDNVVASEFCAQEGCNDYLDEGDIKLVAKLQGGNKMIDLDDATLGSLAALRLSREAEKKKQGGQRLMVLRKVRPASANFPTMRHLETRQLLGQQLADKVFLYHLWEVLNQSKSELVVHFAVKHQAGLTAESEHVAIIKANPDHEGVLELHVLLPQTSMLAFEKVSKPQIGGEEFQRTVRMAISEMPHSTNDADPDLADTRYGHGLNAVVEAAKTGGQIRELPTVDYDGKQKAAMARLVVAHAKIVAACANEAKKRSKKADPGLN